MPQAMYVPDRITADREYSSREVEFLKAIEDYIHTTGHKFPSWTEVLEIITLLGYRKETIPIPTEVVVKTFVPSDRKDILKKWPESYWMIKKSDWSVGTYLIRKSFKDFASSYGTYFGPCKDGFAVGVRRLCVSHIHTLEVYESLEDLKFIWEVSE